MPNTSLALCTLADHFFLKPQRPLYLFCLDCWKLLRLYAILLDFLDLYLTSPFLDTASRTLYSLALNGRAPRIFTTGKAPTASQNQLKLTFTPRSSFERSADLLCCCHHGFRRTGLPFRRIGPSASFRLAPEHQRDVGTRQLGHHLPFVDPVQPCPRASRNLTRFLAVQGPLYAFPGLVWVDPVVFVVLLPFPLRARCLTLIGISAGVIALISGFSVFLKGNWTTSGFFSSYIR